MPEMLVDWPAIKREYLKGVAPQLLAAKYQVGLQTLYARRARGGWRAERDKYIAAAESRASQSALISVTQGGATRFVERVKARVDAGLTVMEVNEPETMPELERSARILESLNRVGRQAHGLDENAGVKHGGLTVNFSLLREEPTTLEAETVSVEQLPDSSEAETVSVEQLPDSSVKDCPAEE